MTSAGAHFIVVMPVFNAPPDRVGRTIASVQGQNAVKAGRAKARVVVVGPTAKSDTPEVALESPISLEVRQAPDEGMYDALAGVLSDVKDGFVSYLGAGDTLEPQAFDIVLENAPGEASVPWWITGMIVGRRCDGAIVRVNLPYRYSHDLFSSGANAGRLPGIQQESTFWNGAMNEAIDFSEFRIWKLAGDYYLWLTFLERAEPTIVEAVLGSFLWHKDNRSQDWNGYMREVRRMTSRPRASQRVRVLREKALWALPNRWKIALRRDGIRRWAWPDGPWI